MRFVVGDHERIKEWFLRPSVSVFVSMSAAVRDGYRRRCLVHTTRYVNVLSAAPEMGSTPTATNHNYNNYHNETSARSLPLVLCRSFSAV